MSIKFHAEAAIPSTANRVLVFILVQATGGQLASITRKKSMSVFAFKYKKRMMAQVLAAILKHIIAKRNLDAVVRLKPGEQRGVQSPQASKYFRRGTETENPPHYYVMVDKMDKK